MQQQQQQVHFATVAHNRDNEVGSVSELESTVCTGCLCVCERVKYRSSGKEMFRLEESFSEMLLRLSRCGRDALYSSRRHKPGNEVKLFLRRTQRFMATVKEKEQRMK